MDKDQLAKTIGENIFYYRKAAQMTQGKLAEQLQVFRQMRYYMKMGNSPTKEIFWSCFEASLNPL